MGVRVGYITGEGWVDGSFAKEGMTGTTAEGHVCLACAVEF